MNRFRQSGFTLIEVMIVVAIIAILAGIALPAYQQSVLKSNRSAARAAIMDVMSKQEQFFVNNKAYATTLGDLGLPNSFYVDDQSQESTAGEAVYLVSLVLLSGAYDGVQAVPQNRQLNESLCKTLSMSKVGARGQTGVGSVSECW